MQPGYSLVLVSWVVSWEWITITAIDVPACIGVLHTDKNASCDCGVYYTTFSQQLLNCGVLNARSKICNYDRNFIICLICRFYYISITLKALLKRLPFLYSLLTFFVRLRRLFEYDKVFCKPFLILCVTWLILCPTSVSWIIVFIEYQTLSR